MATPLPVPFGGELVGEHIAFRWSLVHRDSAQVVAIGACDSEGTYLASKAHCPPECDFVDMPSTTNRDTNNILRFMAYDFERKEFFIAKEKIEAAGLTLDEVKAIMMPSAEPQASSGPWHNMPKTKATRAE